MWTLPAERGNIDRVIIHLSKKKNKDDSASGKIFHHLKRETTMFVKKSVQGRKKIYIYFRFVNCGNNFDYLVDLTYCF